MQWYFVYAGEQLKTATDKGGWQFTYEWWGLIQFVAGVLGANLAGWVSDKVFHSRRAPAAGLLYATLTAGVALMTFFLTNSWVLCSLSFVNILAVIGIHGLLSGTATMDFGGRRGTATAVGIIDGFVYLGTGFQSITLGRITEMEGGWSWWPPFLFPFAVIGFVLLRRIWNAMPSGRKTSH
jgi:OPA family glycerol-3-phosphate transporter-like MFS transporter